MSEGKYLHVLGRLRNLQFELNRDQDSLYSDLDRHSFPRSPEMSV